MVRPPDICRLHPHDSTGAFNVKVAVLVLAVACLSALIANAGKMGQISALAVHHPGHNSVARIHRTAGLASSGLWDR